MASDDHAREARLIQLTRTGLTADASQVAALRAEFDAVHCLCIPHLLEPCLLNFVQQRLEQGRWKTAIHPDVAEEYLLKDRPALELLHFIANLGDFRKLIQEITGCSPLRRFKGRVYRMEAGAGHYDHWHDDNCEQRLVGMSLNLSLHPFQGGKFQIRETGSEQILGEIANTGSGSAVIFRIAEHLQHRISDMAGDEPKTAFAGWFRPDLPDFFDELRAKAVALAPSAR